MQPREKLLKMKYFPQRLFSRLNELLFRLNLRKLVISESEIEVYKFEYFILLLMRKMDINVHSSFYVRIFLVDKNAMLQFRFPIYSL